MQLCCKVSTFGESHGVGVGCIVDGIPANLPLRLGRIPVTQPIKDGGGRPASAHAASAGAELADHRAE